MQTTNRAEQSDLEIKVGYTPVDGWEWLTFPALLIIAIGGLGLFAAYGESAARSLAFLRMPPVWSCCVMVIGGGMLLAISALANTHRRHKVLSGLNRKSWRSL